MFKWFKKAKKPGNEIPNEKLSESTNQCFIQNHSVTGQSKMFKSIEKKNFTDTFSKGPMKNQDSDDNTLDNDQILKDLDPKTNPNQGNF